MALCSPSIVFIGDKYRRVTFADRAAGRAGCGGGGRIIGNVPNQIISHVVASYAERSRRVWLSKSAAAAETSVTCH